MESKDEWQELCDLIEKEIAGKTARLEQLALEIKTIGLEDGNRTKEVLAEIKDLIQEIEEHRKNKIKEFIANSFQGQQ